MLYLGDNIHVVACHYMLVQESLGPAILGWRHKTAPCLSPTSFSKFVRVNRSCLRPGPQELNQLLHTYLGNRLWDVVNPEHEVMATHSAQLLLVFPYPDMLQGTCEGSRQGMADL